MAKFLGIFFGILLLLSDDCADAQRKVDSLGFKIDGIFRKYNWTSGPGCAIGIVDHGKVIFQKGYGIANLEYGIPITPETIFDIASVSKQFTGLAVSKLIEERKISAEDDIRKYLPEVPQFPKTITVRHLIHHLSGIRDWPQTLNVAGWRWDEVFSFSDIMRMVKFQKDLDFTPGDRFSYSNTGYNLLAAIVEKVSEVSFARWMDSTIFEPLAMNDTHFLDDYTKIIKDLAYSYSPQDDGFRKAPSALTAYGSSSLFTSVEDLCKWVINFQSMLDTNNPVYVRMLNDGVLNNGEKSHYGYGLQRGLDRGLKNIAHTGAWAGYRTIISNYPDEKLSIIILSNSADFVPQDYASQVADLFLKDKFEKPQETENYKELPVRQVDTVLMRKYAGSYQLGPGWVVTISFENGKLETQANGEDKFPTAAKSDSVFWVEAYNAAMIFVKDKSGAVNLLRYKGIQAKRIIPWISDPKKYPEYTGTYFSEELATIYKIDVANNKLFLHHRRLGDLELMSDPSAVEQFNSEVGTIRFFRNQEQKIVGFKLSGGRVKNIVFDKQ